MGVSSQTGIKSFNKADVTKYAFYLGGVNTTNKALQNLDPLKTGYARIFITQMPKFMEILEPEKTKWFKHLLETSFTNISGLGNLSMEFESLQGGIPGASMEMPTLLKDDTSEITISLYEHAGSPIREYITSWLSGVSDRQTGYTTYNGLLEGENITKYNLTAAQCNQTMEMFYVSSDSTGLASGIEYGCLLTNMFPKGVREDQFNVDSGTVQSVKFDISFTANKYVSIDINEKCKQLMTKYKIIQQHLNMSSGYSSKDIDDMPNYQLQQ